MRTEDEQDFLVKSLYRELPNGKVIIDEMCACGELRSKHCGLLGHGGFNEICRQFTWANFIFEE